MYKRQEEGLAGSVIVVGAGEADERLRGCGGVDGCGRVGEHAGKRQRGTAGNHEMCIRDSYFTMRTR